MAVATVSRTPAPPPTVRARRVLPRENDWVTRNRVGPRGCAASPPPRRPESDSRACGDAALVGRLPRGGGVPSALPRVIRSRRGLATHAASCNVDTLCAGCRPNPPPGWPRRLVGVAAALVSELGSDPTEEFGRPAEGRVLVVWAGGCRSASAGRGLKCQCGPNGPDRAADSGRPPAPCGGARRAAADFSWRPTHPRRASVPDSPARATRGPAGPSPQCVCSVRDGCQPRRGRACRLAAEYTANNGAT